MSHQETEAKSLREAIAAAGVKHWLVVAILTLAGLLVAELPVFPRIRDRVYIWLQRTIHRPEKRVIVVAIDDAEFRRGVPAGITPLNRTYLAELVDRISLGNPDVIALDIGLETAAPRGQLEIDKHLSDTQKLLAKVDEVAQKNPVVLTKTISGKTAPFRLEHDVFDAYVFHPDAEVLFGHTSAAKDIRQIPTRVRVERGPPLDSFALAIVRATSRDAVSSAYESPDHAWPYSQFLPMEAFAPRMEGSSEHRILTPADIRSATVKNLRRWLRGKIVIVGGMWHDTPHGGEDSKYVDQRDTPVGPMPGVITHANYVQSLLIGPMFPMPDHWRVAIEIVLAVGVSLIFLRSRGWRRARRIVLTILTVVILTWMFRATIGIFFDFVVPVTFLAVHVICEELGDRFQIVSRQPGRGYSRFAVASLAIVAVALAGAVTAHEIGRVQHQLDTEHRLQVTEANPSRFYISEPASGVAPVIYAEKEQKEAEEQDRPVPNVVPGIRAPMPSAAMQDKYAEADPRFTATQDLAEPQTEEARQRALEEAVSQRIEAEMAKLQSEYAVAQARTARAAEVAKERPAAAPAPAASAPATGKVVESAEFERKTTSKTAAADLSERERDLVRSLGKMQASGSRDRDASASRPAKETQTNPCQASGAARLADTLERLTGESNQLIRAELKDSKLLVTLPPEAFTEINTPTSGVIRSLATLKSAAADPCIYTTVTFEYASGGGDAAFSKGNKRTEFLANALSVVSTRVDRTHTLLVRDMGNVDDVTVVIKLRY